MTQINNLKLYSKNKTGKALEWAASVLEKDEKGYIPIEIVFGQVGGKLQQKIVLKHSLKEPGKYIKGVYLIFFNVFFKYFSKL